MPRHARPAPVRGAAPHARLTSGRRGPLGREDGVIFVTVLGVILIVTLLVGALVVATMSETALSSGQLRGAQALFLAEAGAYRALAELRHRLAVQLDARLATATGDALAAWCASDQGAMVVAAFAHFEGPSDWRADPGRSEAVLALGGGRPIAVLGRDGREVGTFTATVRVRSAGGDAPPPECRSGAEAEERYRFFVHYEVVAVGSAGGARRGVRLSSPPDRPVELLLERASLARWALLLLETSETWLTDGTVVDGPAHTNGEWWVWGAPVFGGPVSSAAPTIRFGNCGAPVSLRQADNPRSGSCAGDRPVYRGGPPHLGVSRVAFPDSPPKPARAALGLDPVGPDPVDTDIQRATADQAGARGAVLVANDGISVRHPDTRRPGGLYIRGDVERMVLAAEGSRQVILLRLAEGRSPVWRVEIDWAAEEVRVNQGERAGAGRTYRGRPNGVVFVEGAIRGLSGTVHRDSVLTIAASGDIRLVDHLVYAEPPGRSGEAVNLLALYSTTGSVLVDGAEAPRDLYVDAVVLAPRGRFAVDGHDTVEDRGTLHLLGGIVQATFGPVGSFDPLADLRRGYTRVIRHDRRLQDRIPPALPRSARFAAVRRPPDSLYDKPVWQEIPVPQRSP